MGLGKTIQSITFLYEIFSMGIRGPFLIIAPLSTITNWEREFRTWTHMNVIVYHGSQISRQMILQYEMFHRDAQVMLLSLLQSSSVLSSITRRMSQLWRFFINRSAGGEEGCGWLSGLLFPFSRAPILLKYISLKNILLWIICLWCVICFMLLFCDKHKMSALCDI